MREKEERGDWRKRGEMGNGGQNDEKKREREEGRENTVCAHCTLRGSISRDWSKLTRL